MSYRIHHGDVLQVLRGMPSASVNCCITSPPYFGLRDYGIDGQLGLEPTPDLYVAKMVEVFAEVRRVLRDDGTLWLNLGDSYAAGKAGRTDHGSGDATCRLGHQRNSIPGGTIPGPVVVRKAPEGLKPKDLIGIPWRVALALQADGWYLRSDIIWSKPNPMPESVTDRPTKAHEYVFLLSKSERYFYNAPAVAESVVKGAACSDFNTGKTAVHQLGRAPSAPRAETMTRNKRTVWTLATLPTPDAHFATFPIELPETCLKAGCPLDGVVLDPFAGSGTTGLAAIKNGRKFVGIELNPEYIQIAHRRLERHYPLLTGGAA